MGNLHLFVMQAHHMATLLAPAPPAPATVPAPMTDPTGTNAALENIAKWAAGLGVGFLMLGMVWQGLQYMMTHDLNRSTQFKLAAIGLVGGFAIVVLAVNLAPEFLNLILGV